MLVLAWYGPKGWWQDVRGGGCKLFGGWVGEVGSHDDLTQLYQ